MVVRCESSEDPPPGVVLPGVMRWLRLSVGIVVSGEGGVLGLGLTSDVTSDDDEDDDEDEDREKDDG